MRSYDAEGDLVGGFAPSTPYCQSGLRPSWIGSRSANESVDSSSSLLPDSLPLSPPESAESAALLSSAAASESALSAACSASIRPNSANSSVSGLSRYSAHFVRGFCAAAIRTSPSFICSSLCACCSAAAAAAAASRCCSISFKAFSICTFVAMSKTPVLVRCSCSFLAAEHTAARHAPPVISLVPAAAAVAAARSQTPAKGAAALL